MHPGDFEGLIVELNSIEAYVENEGWVMLNNDVQSINVLNLTNGAETQLALKTEAKAEFTPN